MHDTKLKEAIEFVADLIAGSKRCVVFTGAGISTESGIPDFRSPGGIWSKYNPTEFTYQKFLASKENRRLRWQMIKETTAMFQAQPNTAHKAIAELENISRLDCVITQNIDNLHQAAGNKCVIELHGNALWIYCLDCDAHFPRSEIQARLEAGEEIPDCSHCGGMLKLATVSFGEPMPVKETEEAAQRSSRADVFIVIGSSLVVHPAAMMPVYAKQAGGTLVIINMSPTPHDKYADVIIRMKAGEVIPAIVERVKQKIAQ